METNWRERAEAGNTFGLWFTVLVGRYLGRSTLHAMLVPISFYFFLVRGVERRASREFLRRATGSPVSGWQVYRHFLTFAYVAADRIYFMTGKSDRIPVRFHNFEKLKMLSRRGQGGVVLAAHLGSFEVARVLGTKASGIVVRIVLDKNVNRRFVKILESLNSEFSQVIIDPGQSAASLGLKVAEAIERGEWVGFLADRFVTADRTVECEFLGQPARFALGPLLVAAAFKAPVYCIFPLYVDGRYEVYVEEVTESLDVPRNERDQVLRESARKFSGYLERYARLAPYNWFNFYDFWAKS